MSSIGKKTSNVFVWIIMLLLIAGLGGFGVSNFGGSNSAIATVGDTEVSVDEYYRALQQELRGFQAQTGQPLSLTAAKEFGVDANVRARLITGAALDNETMRIGLSIGDDRVRREVLANTAFQGLDGKFDRAGYTRALEQAGLTEAEYEDAIRVETARTILQSAIVNGIKAPDAMTNAFLSYTQERRDFTWLRLDQNNLTDVVPEPTDAQLQTFYEANAADFTEPEKKRMTYIWVTPEMIVDNIEVPEADLLEEYNKRLDEYSKPERRLVERLIFPNTADIEAAKSRLDAGETTFEALVVERGLTLLDIDLGDVTLDALDTAGDAIFAMSAPGVIGPVDTNLGPALYRMNGIIAATEISFDEVRAQLLDELALDRARRQINAGISDIDDLLAGGASLQEVADETDLRLAQMDWAQGNSDGIANYSAFRDAAGALNDGDYAEVRELDDGGIFALEFNALIAPALNPIDTVMSDVITGWENQEIETRLTAMADDLLAQISGGADMATLGFDVTTEVGLLRESTIVGTPFDFVSGVFEMDKGAARIVDGNGVVFIAHLDDILPPDATNPDLAEIKTGLQTAISQALADDIFAAYNGALQTEAGVYVNSAVVNAVHAQFPQ
ncbi:SurA N-terminal domain-containing protein [Profundibacter sp.]